MKTSYKTYAIAGATVASTLLLAGTAFAATTNSGHWGPGMNGHIQGNMHPGVAGTVTAVSGSTITISSTSHGPRGQGTSAATQSTATTYMVDASNATVTKSGATSTVASIAVGDTVMVQGTVNGTNVTATMIRDGMPGGMHPGQGQGGMMANFKGNGQPVIGGTVNAISGSTLTITNTSNVTYTVDDTNATVIKQGATSTASSILSGDRVVVQGTVNGSSVTASTIMDNGATSAAQQNTGSPQTQTPKNAGFLGMIGGFFHKLFGFF